MLRTLLAACLLGALATLGMFPEHQEMSRDALDELEDAFSSMRVSPAEAARRDLQQSWTQFNEYFSGKSGAPSPGNLPTYYGRLPGPCPSAPNTNVCSGKACQMQQSVKDIQICPDPIPRWILGCKKISEWINTQDCTNNPGDVMLYNTDAGALRIGGIYLDTTPQNDPADIITPTSPLGFAPESSAFDSEKRYFNQFRMTFTLSEVRLELDTQLKIDRLQLKSPLTFTLSKSDVGAKLLVANQAIDNSNHAISFRTSMIFKSNQKCNAVGSGTSNSTCIYRSDKLPRSTFYRNTPDRTETFKDGVVYEIDLPRSGNKYADASCLFDFPNQYATSNKGAQHSTQLGLQLDIGSLCNFLGFDVCRIILNAILNLVIGAILKGILCQLITGMFYITENSVVTTKRGPVNKGLETLYNFLKKYVETPLPTEADARKLEDVTVPANFTANGYDWPGAAGCAVSSYCPHPSAVNFNTSDIFKSVSLGLNGLLGNLSTTPGYTDKLTIVEVIDILTGNKKGELKVGLCPDGASPPSTTEGYTAGTCDGDIKAELKLADYPRFEWTESPIFNGAIQLNGLFLTDINSITRMNILDNGFTDGADTKPNFTHTVSNTFSMNKVTVLLDIWLTLTDGSWVHRPRNVVVNPNQRRQIQMRTRVFLSLINLEIAINMMMLLRPDLLSDKKIGSAFGNWPDGNFMTRFRCLAYGLDLLQFPKFELRGSLQTLEFRDFFGDLATVIADGTKVFNYGYFAATNVHLPFLADNFVRPILNDIFWENSFDGRCGTKVNGKCPRPDSHDECKLNYPKYFSDTDPKRYVNFYDSKAWNLVKGLINDVVGGIPVRTGAASINSIIDKYLDWYIPLAANRNITVIKVPNNQVAKEMGNLDFPGTVEIHGDNPDDKYISFSKFQIRNIETVHELSINPLATNEFRVDFKIGGGKIFDRVSKAYITNGNLFFRFHLATEVTQSTGGSPVTFADDQADISVELGNVTVGTRILAKINQNEILDLNFGNLVDAACLLALVDEFDMKTLDIGFKSFKVAINRSGTNWRHRRFCTTQWNVNVCPVGATTSTCAFVSSAHGTPCGPANRRVRFSDALDRLAWEAALWGSKVDNMVQYFFNGISEFARKSINDFAKKQIPIAGCDSVEIFTGATKGLFDKLVDNATDAGSGAKNLFDKFSANQWNPRFPKVDPEDPTNTMIGWRASGPLAIDYSAAPSVWLQQTGFPAGKCNRSALLPAYVALKNDSCWEDKVIIPAGETVVDIHHSYVVTELQRILAKSGKKLLLDSLDALSQLTGNLVSESLTSYKNGDQLPDSRGPCNSIVDGLPSFCIDLDMNVSSFNISFQNNEIIPGMFVFVRRIKALNLETFEADPETLDILQPYIPNQWAPAANQDLEGKFTLANRVRFGGSSFLSFAVDVDISVASKFINGGTSETLVTDRMSLAFKLKNLDIQFMTMTAINATRVQEIPLNFYFDPFGPEKCLFSIFYENGIHIPQFQVYISDIEGPTATITGLQPPSATANILSAGVGELITSSIEIIAQIFRADLPDATQGEFRKYLNRVLGDFLRDARDSIGPGSCQLPDDCQGGFCDYLNWFDEAKFVIENVNKFVGGNPVTLSQFDVNTLAEMGLEYALLNPDGPQLQILGANTSHPATGDWVLPEVLNYVNGQSKIRITNIGLLGVDSIYKLVLANYQTKPYSIGLDFAMGGGSIINGTSKLPLLTDRLVFTAELEAKVIVKRSSGLDETLADNKFRVELGFKGINIAAIQQVLVNRTDLVRLNIVQVSNTQCILSVVDKVTLETIALSLTDFDVNIPLNDCINDCSAPKFGRNPPNCNSAKCKLGTAIDTLRNEATASNPQSPSNATNMINTILRNVADVAVNSFNKLTIWNTTRENCDVPKVDMNINYGAGLETDADTKKLVARLLSNMTGILTFPGPKVSPDRKKVMIQSERLGGTAAERQAFIQEAIISAKDALGPVPTPAVILTEGSFCDDLGLSPLLRPVCSANLTALLEDWTSNSVYPIGNKISPINIENDVRINVEKEQYYDIRTSQIVASVSKYFDDKASNLEGLIRELANNTDLLKVEPDQSVTLEVNMTDAIFFLDKNFIQGKTCDGAQKNSTVLLQDILGTTDGVIPGLRILPGTFKVTNFGSFSKLMILRPYVVDGVGARFTTQHEFGWEQPNKPLGISLNVDMYYDSSFLTGSPIKTGVEMKEAITLTMAFEGLLVQVLTLLAIDTKQLGEIRLGDFLNVDISQEFKRNCKALTCLMRGIFEGGLSIPQLTVNATNIIGPSFSTTGTLFSLGMTQFIDALMEIGVQLFREDLPSLTQGPLRTLINEKLEETLVKAKLPGSCPERRNYTRDYPLGEKFCSNADSTGVSAVPTQTEEACRAKGNGRTCKWAPPDGQINEQTIACVYTTEATALNFQTSTGLKQLKSFINGSLMNPDSALYINTYLGAFASKLGTKLYEIDGFPLKYNGFEYGTVRLGIGALNITGVNTVDRLQLFDPAPYGPGGDSAFANGEEYEPVPASRLLLNVEEDDMTALTVSNRRELATNKFGYSDNRYTSRTAIGFKGPLKIGFEVLFSFDELFVPREGGPTDYVENHIGLDFTFTDLDIAIDLYMLINIPRLMDLQVRSIGTIYELPCILEIFEDNGLVPVRANITYGVVGFNIACRNRCDSPLFSPIKTGGFTDEMSDSLRTKFTDMVKRITDFLIKLLASSDAQEYLDRQISISNKQCEAIKTTGIQVPDTSGSNHHSDAASAMGIAGLSTLFASFVAFALLVPVHFRRRDELMKRALLDAHTRGTAGKSKDEFELAERRLKSAFEHPMMNVVVRFGVPFWILCNIVFFATANFAAPGCIVELTLSIAGDTTYPITLLPFTLERSINDMWLAGVYPLAVIIALASGGWPYAKQVMLLFAWFAPATVLHPSARGRLLEVLDTLGKWSLIDVYVLVMLMVAFRFYISSSYVQGFSLLPPDVLVVDVAVTPGWGIFGFVLGAMGSLLVNHVMIWHHRKVVRMDEDLQDAILGTLVKDLRTPRIPLSRHRFNILDAEGRPYRYSVTVRVMFVFTLSLVFILLIIGAVLPVLQFTFRGIAGLAIAFIDESLAVVVHSVVSIGTSLIGGARDTTSSILGILFIQILYILFALIVPLLLCVLLMAIWLVPLTLREQILLYFVAEVLSAWEALLVLVFSCVACTLQISQLAQFIVDAATGSLCKALEGQLQKIFPDPEDARCFDVIAVLVPSSVVIIVAAALLTLASSVTFRLVHTAIEDRELAMRRKPPHSPGEMTGLTGFIIRRSLEAFGASQVQNGGSVANLYAQDKGAFDYRDSQMTPANPILAREMPQSMGGMQAPNPMFHGSMGSARVGHQSIDV